MSGNATSFTKAFEIDADWFIDPDHQQNNFTKLLEAVLETSVKHDHAIHFDSTVPFLNQDESWVITQNISMINQLPHYGDDIEVTTKIIQANRFFLERWFEVRTRNVLLLECQIQFAIINLITRKMGRIDHKRMEELGLIDSQQNVLKSKLLLSKEFNFWKKKNQVILAEDIDFNNHVNNLVYINWAINSLPQWVNDHYHIKQLKIKYGHELLSDQQVRILSYSDNALDSYHAKDQITTYQAIYNESQNQEAARIEIQWLKTET
ncbi:acyl-ACP thioesterase domain-containing protein [Facklamia miroungae]|uniref:Acyl-ACP thioesterase n=1 Tax=Facklamia miroungae TaxID=120956 RepID=A0A1G7TIC7_9LACT|nr:acyl-ACP thioesterase domain-containing protein [Facklamia miroungae]NKZ29830.1 hypothetical protein [Facklamia miroungae]SDG34862.1 Acyl-ACP thioesterase [Facklamia miroungae]